MYNNNNGYESDPNLEQYEFNSDDEELTLTEEEEERLLLKTQLLHEYKKNYFSIQLSNRIDTYSSCIQLIKDIMKTHLFFHATSLVNRESILEKGIIPDYGKGLTKSFDTNATENVIACNNNYVTSSVTLAQYYGNYLTIKDIPKYIMFGIIIDTQELQSVTVDANTFPLNGNVHAFKYPSVIQPSQLFNPFIEPFYLNSPLLNFICDKIQMFPKTNMLQFYIMGVYYDMYLKGRVYHDNFNHQLKTNAMNPSEVDISFSHIG